MHTEQLDAYRQMLRLLERLFGETPAAAFGCPELEAICEVMIRPRQDPETGVTLPGWCRNHANRQVAASATSSAGPHRSPGRRTG